MASRYAPIAYFGDFSTRIVKFFRGSGAFLEGGPGFCGISWEGGPI